MDIDENRILSDLNSLKTWNRIDCLVADIIQIGASGYGYVLHRYALKICEKKL